MVALRDVGYEAGRTARIVSRYADGRFDRLPELAAGLLAERVDVIMARTTPAALAAKAATQTVLIVFYLSGDVVGSGLVSNLARPDGNVTGIGFEGREIAVKCLQYARELAPDAKRVALLAHPGIAPEINFHRDMLAAASQRARLLAA